MNHRRSNSTKILKSPIRVKLDEVCSKVVEGNKVKVTTESTRQNYLQLNLHSINGHRRSYSTKILNNPLGVKLEEIISKEKKGIKTNSIAAVTRKNYLHYNRYSEQPSVVKSLDYIVAKCDNEQKKIKKISEKIKIYRKKLTQNQEIISSFIQRPLYCLKLLKKVRPQYLNRNFKYQ